MRVMECINIRPSLIGTEKKENCKFTNVQVLNLLMLFPFFVVRNAYQYSGSSLSRLFSCEKDMFYRFMDDGNKELFGEDRIFDELNRAIQDGQLSPKAVIDRMIQAVHDFVGDAEQSDDLTMLAIRI